MSTRVVCINCNSLNITMRIGEIVRENDSNIKCLHFRCSDCQKGWLQDTEKILCKVDF